MKKISALFMLLCILLLAACAFQNDRMWISEEKYNIAKKAYDDTTSLNLTEKALRESGTWQPGEINEAIYRLKKEYRLEQSAPVVQPK